MLISGHVKDNIIFLDEDIVLPDGMKVSVMVPEKAGEKSSGFVRYLERQPIPRRKSWMR